MSVQTLSSLDRTVFQPLGRIIQEAFADGLIGTGSITITKDFATTSGYNKLMYLTVEISGAGGSAYGMFKFRTKVSGALSANAHAVCAQLFLDTGCTLINTPEYASAALYVTVETEVAGLTLSGGSLAALYIGYYVDESGAGPIDAYPFYFNTDQSKGQWDGLFMAQSFNDIGGVLTVESGDAGYGSIPVKVSGGVKYLHLWNAAA